MWSCSKRCRKNDLLTPDGLPWANLVIGSGVKIWVRNWCGLLDDVFLFLLAMSYLRAKIPHPTSQTVTRSYTGIERVQRLPQRPFSARAWLFYYPKWPLTGRRGSKWAKNKLERLSKVPDPPTCMGPRRLRRADGTFWAMHARPIWGLMWPQSCSNGLGMWRAGVCMCVKTYC